MPGFETELGANGREFADLLGPRHSGIRVVHRGLQLRQDQRVSSGRAGREAGLPVRCAPAGHGLRVEGQQCSHERPGIPDQHGVRDQPVAAQQVL